MARARNKLTSKGVDALTEAGRHSDGGGLYLAIDGEGAAQRRRWLYLYQWGGKRREMGLGGFPVVTLKAARIARDDAERLLRDGVDPIAARAASKNDPVRVPTFGEVADDLIASLESQWRNDKHRWQWSHTLTVYAKALRAMPVDQVSTVDVLAVLTPLWSAKPETASRLRGRIEAVLDAAKAKGHRTGENPAAWRGHLSHLLPKRQKLTRGHHAAMAYEDVPAFIAKIRERRATSALALEFTILTAARSGEALGAKWDEIDTVRKLWTIPANRMKAGNIHRVPLCGRALEILEQLSAVKNGPFVFANHAGDGSMSNMAMLMMLRRIEPDLTVHGFRSAFRDWAGNETHFMREVAEAALAHQVGDEVERAYRRGDALEKRRELMDAWAAYCEPKASGGAQIIPMKQREA